MEKFNSIEIKNESLEKQWNDMANEIDKTHDGLGKEIDPGIKDAIIALNLLGINTIQSCEGHNDERIISPYITIESSESEIIEKEIEKLNEEGREDEAEKLYDRAREMNVREYFKAFPYLDEFYKEKASTPFDQRLIIKELGWDYGRIESQGACSLRVLPIEEQKRKIELYKKEIKDFSKFIKGKFFQGA